MRADKFKIVLLLSSLCVPGFAQEFNAYYKTHSHLDTLMMDLYLESAQTSAFGLGNCKFEMNYDDEALTFIGKDPSIKGQWDKGTSNYYFDTFAIGVGNVVIFRIFCKAQVDGEPVPARPGALAGRLLFLKKDPNKQSGLKWNKSFTVLTSDKEFRMATNLTD